MYKNKSEGLLQNFTPGDHSGETIVSPIGSYFGGWYEYFS